MRQKFFGGLVAVGCGIAASFVAAATMAGCTGDDLGAGTAITTDAGTIILDSGTKPDAATADAGVIVVVDASVCPSAQALCSGSCATLARDTQNCGACGVTCGAGEACSAGKCTTTCGGDQSFCGPADAGDAGAAYCASFASDNTSCGSCGHQCGAGEMCSNGSCQTTCGASQTACNVGDAGADAGHGGAPFCATTSSDDSNCGACGNACSAGESCMSGVCKVTCAVSETLCSSEDGTTNGTDGGVPYCAITASDNANCGACGHTCGAGQVCNGGVCGTTCAAPETICSSVDGSTDGTDGGAPYCANFGTDNANCGSCGSSCGAGQACVNGSCSTTCEGDLLLCGSKCIDPSSSITNCGATAACDGDAGTSGTACDPTTQACSAGVCAALKPVPKFVASFNVNDGPEWSTEPPPPAYSCVQACALLNGGDPSDYGCSTVDGSLNHLAWGSNNESSDHCAPGTPVDDTYSNGDVYDVGVFSAYVRDNCFDGSINYCWTVPPTGP